MFEILSTIMKYIFIIIIYLFIYAIIRLIYLDIRSISSRTDSSSGKYPYLKLLNIRDDLSFKIDESYALNGNKTLGRSRKNDIIINDPYLSGEHAEFTFKEGLLYISDRGSTNGTFVNNERITGEMIPLNNGDRIQVGKLTFILVRES